MFAYIWNTVKKNLIYKCHMRGNFAMRLGIHDHWANFDIEPHSGTGLLDRAMTS